MSVVGLRGARWTVASVWQKQALFDRVLRVPLVIYDPRLPSTHGQVVSQTLVELIDIYPTLADLAGLPLPPELKGESFKEAMLAPDVAFKSMAVAQSPRCHPVGLPSWGRNECLVSDLKGNQTMGYSLRTARFRYTAWITFDHQHRRLCWDAPEAAELYDFSSRAALPCLLGFRTRWAW